MPLPPRYRSVVIGVAASLLALAGCRPQPDLASLRTSVLVEAPGAQMTGADLERWLLASPTQPVPFYSAWLVSTWIDNALLAEAIRSGKGLDDSVSIAAAMWPDAARGAILELLAARDRKLPPVTDALADSLDEAGTVRVFQQLMQMVAPKADSQTNDAAVQRLYRYRSLAEGGEDFTKLVHQFSQDSDSKARDGFLRWAVGRDSLPPQVAGLFWSLERGVVSVPISIPGGYAIFRRAKGPVARPYLKAWLAPGFADRADAAFRDSVLTATKLVVAKGSIERIRAMAAEPLVAEGTEPLASWDGGKLLPETARRWVALLKPDFRMNLAVASDSTVRRYLLEMALGDAILAIAASPVPSPAAWHFLSGQYRVELDSARRDLLHIAGTPPAPDAANRMLDSLALRGREYFQLPGILGGMLRARFPVKVDNTKARALFDAVLIEWREKHAGDSPVAPSRSRP